MNSKKGFTLIELLVVIAIIGILSGIVLTSLSSARNKASDAKSKGQLASFRSAAELYYSTNNHYGDTNATGHNVCSQGSTDTTGLYNIMLGANYQDGIPPTCTTDAGASSQANKWSAWKKLTDNSYWCVDSVGSSKGETAGWTAPTAGAACP